MTDIILGAQPAINWEALDTELRAALKDKLDGTTYADGVLTVQVADGVNAEALRPSIAAVLAAHDPSVKTAGQQAEARQLQATTDLALEDFSNLKDAINALSVSAEVKQVLRRLNRNTARLALAIRANAGTDPGT